MPDKYSVFSVSSVAIYFYVLLFFFEWYVFIPFQLLLVLLSQGPVKDSAEDEKEVNCGKAFGKYNKLFHIYLLLPFNRGPQALKVCYNGVEFRLP